MAGATQPANNVVGRLIQRCLRVHRPALQGIESKHTTIHNMERSTKSPQAEENCCRIIPVEDSDLEYPNPPLEDEDDYVFMKTAKKSKVEKNYEGQEPINLGETFSLARIIKARFEAIAEKEKEHINEKKAYTILSLQHKLASPEIKGSLDADEDIHVDKVSNAIECVIHIGESNEVRRKFGEFLDNKECVVEVVVGGGEALGVYREKSR
ncbi:hypothetical protein Tco_1080832 [Tanacetum coccineum]|uniref:Uncharacterized protein n=1 Tax=Tanacetum coccineum TaxID=301880 RepID=A0ABQ5HXU7_9ASTR